MQYIEYTIVVDSKEDNDNDYKLIYMIEYYISLDGKF
jgi:hypothetical protein